jgi:uncharacterized protein (UPF0332 family)
MPEENRTALANYRLERAAGELASARANLDADRYAESLSDSYYAIFHSIRAALALEGKDFKKHSGVIQKVYSLIREYLLDKGSKEQN